MSTTKPTIRDIANLANVSPASVSLILNNKKISRFSAETVHRVRTIAKELHYQTKHSKPTLPTIMIICPSLVNPYYASLIQSMEQEAILQGFRTTIHTTYWNKVFEQQLLENAILADNVCGIIFAMIPQQPHLVKSARECIPIVAVGDRLQSIGIDTVDINNFQAGELIAQHLVELNHLNIAYISTSLNEEHSARMCRYEGLKSYYHSFLPSGHVYVYTTNVSSELELQTLSIEYDVGYQLAQSCIQENPSITALVAINDMVAYGVLDGLSDLGIQIPQDVSVCAFDNIFPSKFRGIQLTTVEHSIQERGRSALHLLTSQLANIAPSGAINRVEYACKLIARDTTATAPSNHT